MVDKPKTYAQQVQELRAQLTDRVEEITDLRSKLSTITSYEKKIEELEAELSKKSKENTNSVRADKAKTTDLEQRAVSAEQALKDANNKLQAITYENTILQEHLSEIIGLKEKLEEREAKINQLNSIIIAENQKNKQIQQQANDAVAIARSEVESVHGELKTLRLNKQGYVNRISQLEEKLAEESTAQYSANQKLVIDNNELRSELDKCRQAINNYEKLVDEIPDTRSQLLAILRKN